MASSKWQRRHYETVAAGLRAKKASASEVEAWVNKFKADNPRFNTAIFLAAVQGGTVNRRGVEREYRPVSRPRRPFKVPALAGYTVASRKSPTAFKFKSKAQACKFARLRSRISPYGFTPQVFRVNKRTGRRTEVSCPR